MRDQILLYLQHNQDEPDVYWVKWYIVEHVESGVKYFSVNVCGGVLWKVQEQNILPVVESTKRSNKSMQEVACWGAKWLFRTKDWKFF